MADTIYDPTIEIFTFLSSIEEGVYVSEDRPEEIPSLPAITFQTSNNSVKLELSKGIGYQDIEVTVDIWGESTVDTERLFVLIESGMRSRGYELASSFPVPDPSPDNIAHKTAKFNLIA